METEEIIETGVEETVSPTENTAAEEAQETVSPTEKTGEESKEEKGQLAALKAERHRRQEAEKEAAYYRGLNQNQQTNEADSSPTEGPPSIDDFEDTEEYNRAVVRYEARQIVQEERQQAAQQEQLEKIKKAVDGIHERGRKEYADWESVTNIPNLPISELMRDAMVQMPEGEKVFYHLGKHPHLAAEIAQMQPYQAAVQLSKIEAQVKGPAPKTTTQAPEPAKTVGANETPIKNEEDMETGELIAHLDRLEFGVQ